MQAEVLSFCQKNKEFGTKELASANFSAYIPMNPSFLSFILFTQTETPSILRFFS
jgi:hypothetical protein